MGEATLDMVVVPSEDIVAREIEGDIIIVPLVAGIGDTDDELYTLNETGHAIWRKLDGKRTLGQISQELEKDFPSSPEEIASDVLGFAGEMVNRGILAVRDKNQ